MNIKNLIYASFDFCALILGLFVLFNFIFSKKMDSRNNRLFLGLVISTLVSSLANLVAVIALSAVGCPVWLGNLLTSIYYLAYGLTGVVFIVYAVALIFEHGKIPKKFQIIATGVLFLVVAGAICAAICLFYFGYKDVNSIIKWTYEGIIYGSQVVAFVFASTLAYVERNKLNKTGLVNIFAFSAINVVAVLLQYFVRIQISNFALVVAVLLIYVTLQRPEDSIDATSGAFNAHTFNQRCNMRLSQGMHFYVFVTEINNMTLVNSSFGLNGGNSVIKETVNRLKGLLEKGQYVYRLSGVRFAVIFNKREEYEAFAGKFKSVFDKPFSVNETELRLTSVACVVAVPEITEIMSEVEDLIKYYRNSVNVAEGIITADGEALEKARRYEKVDYAIQNAINKKSFMVYYQPIYSVNDGKFSGCEALIRLKDDELGFISPDEFIPIAEQNGKIIEVGRFVIEEVCRFIKEEKLEELGIEFVDVNLSVIQCMHPEIINDIDATLAKYGVSRKLVNLEITETASASSYAMLQSKLNELHTNGYTISLDDFGTGFATVEYLINYPFDLVKLDKGIVWAYMSDRKYAPILEHYMPMLHGIGVKIVAEGIENGEMEEKMTKLGCDYLQGYHYSRPISGEAFVEFLKKGMDDQQLA